MISSHLIEVTLGKYLLLNETQGHPVKEGFFSLVIFY